MNREIKFRAWNKKINSMGSALPLKVWTDSIATDLGREKYIKNINNIVLMQYTGRKDKNGVEIYEGDIVKIKERTFWDEKDEVGYYDDICHIFSSDFCNTKAFYDLDKKIMWDNGHSYIEDYSDDWENVEDLEVIGNIYENPELLNQL